MPISFNPIVCFLKDFIKKWDIRFEWENMLLKLGVYHFKHLWATKHFDSGIKSF